MGVIIFNGRSSTEFGIEVEHLPDYDTPERDYDIIHVPGRNGDLVIDTGSFKNTSRKYQISVATRGEAFYEKIKPIVEWLHSSSGYARLEDTYEPDYYRLAYYRESNTIDNLFDDAGRATITFTCKPQRYLKSGELPTSFVEGGGKNKLKFPTTAHDVTRCTYSVDSDNSATVTATGTYSGASFLINVTTGVTYTLSFKGVGTGDKKSIWLRAINPWSTSSQPGYYTNIDLTESEEYYHYTFTATTDELYIGYYVTFADSEGEMTLTDVQLEEGIEATDFVPYSVFGTLKNNTVFRSLPLITVKSSNNERGTVIINNQSFQVKESSNASENLQDSSGNDISDNSNDQITTVSINKVTLDSELQDAYDGTVNKNSSIILNGGEFPSLEPGDNDITFSGGVTEVEITPRWWTV